ncbi:hypothetical protein [Streptomyces sp. NPDC051546]|uniref:hypothetical protein n=1 Tax=Streptomyces sp. NPDC051546 TaxID=3365655 RepID=UPI0037B2D128
MAHLFSNSRIDADRRTPLGGRTAAQPTLPGATEWARSMTVPDPTCGKCLLALALIGWEGEFDSALLAEMTGMSIATMDRHRPHLVEFDLLRFRPSSIPAGGGYFRGRGPSTFTLMSGFFARELDDAEKLTVPARAHEIVGRVRWFAGASIEERTSAEIAVGFVLRAGWPDEAILKVLDHATDRNAYKSKRGYLAKLLAKAQGPYLIPAQEVFTGRSGPRIEDCGICRDRVRTTLPLGSRILCGGGVCLNAGKEHDIRNAQRLEIVRVRTA